MARPVDPLSQEGGIGFPPKMRLHNPQRGAERLVGFTTNYNMPHPHYMGWHHVCAAM